MSPRQLQGLMLGCEGLPWSSGRGRGHPLHTPWWAHAACACDAMTQPWGSGSRPGHSDGSRWRLH